MGGAISVVSSRAAEVLDVLSTGVSRGATYGVTEEGLAAATERVAEASRVAARQQAGDDSLRRYLRADLQRREAALRARQCWTLGCSTPSQGNDGKQPAELPTQPVSMSGSGGMTLLGGSCCHEPQARTNPAVCGRSSLRLSRREAS